MKENLKEEVKIRDERFSDHSEIKASIFNEQVKILCHRPALIIGKEASVAELVNLMREKNRGAAVVVDKKKATVGIVTERDLLMKVYGGPENLENTKVSQIMTANPACLLLTDNISYVMNKMHVGGYRHVPIIDENEQPLHLVSMRQVISYILDHFPQEVMNLPLQPFRGKVSRDGG